MSKLGSESDIDAIRHSLAHLLAAAVLKKYPKAKLGIGPIIENGFYYDFLIANGHESKNESSRIKEEDLKEFEDEMRSAIKASLEFKGETITPVKAKTLFKDQPFKLELIKDFVKEKKELTAYKTGDIFLDLCRGGHVENTSGINPEAFKLTHVAGAYWKGSEKNPQMQRIYGVAFETKEKLDAYLTMRVEAEKRDHRKLGKELELFAFSEEVGPGLPLFYPKGTIVRREIENYISELQERRGYQPIWIPHITRSTLYKTSGHLDKFDALYPPMKLKDEDDYYLKPMNCPHFMMLYKTTPHSYREFPIRWTSTTTNYRYEKSGELSGLTRVRALTQDDCHVFVRSDLADPNQAIGEIDIMLDMIAEVYKVFGFNDFRVRLSVRDLEKKEKYIGDPKVWDDSEEALQRTIDRRGWKFEVGYGEAAFYGPKLDFIFMDVLGREWQLSTVQLDMNLPERFDLEYTDDRGSKQRPILIHRAILGSTERFMGILIEHYAGAFPLWLAPVQARILAISEKQSDYAKKVLSSLKDAGLRAELAPSDETLGKRIRGAQLEKIPYTLIVGDKEIEASAVSIRHLSRGNEGTLSVDELVKKLAKEIADKT